MRLLSVGLTAVGLIACSSGGSADEHPDSGVDAGPSCNKTLAPPTDVSHDCAVAGKCEPECGGGTAYSCGEHVQHTAVYPDGLTGCYTETSPTGIITCCNERQCVRRSSEDARCHGQKAVSCAPDMSTPPGCTDPSDVSGIPLWMRIVCCP